MCSDKTQSSTDEYPARGRRSRVPAVLSGLQPAFQHRRSGESHLAQIEPGIPAEVYGFAGLPDDWIVERDKHGYAVALHPDVIPGYWRDARFIALDQLSAWPLDG